MKKNQQKYSKNLAAFKSFPLLLLIGVGLLFICLGCCLSCVLISIVLPDAAVNPERSILTTTPTANFIPTDTEVPKLFYKVTKIIDGDTITVETLGKIRLIGIDSPESTNAQECFGNEAKIKITELINGQNVFIELDPTQGEKDKYDRTLAYVFVAGVEESINFQMIQTGYAFEYTYNKPYKYQESFQKAEEEAKNEKTGLWATITCNCLYSILLI
ncbi:MAG: thermonuclease family protein [bacterium]